MKDQKRQIFGRLWKVFLFTLLIVCGLAVGFDFYYDLNDDTTIKDILSGAYSGTPSGYSVQMLYPLGLLIAVCYRAIPGVAWYGLFLCLCQFGVFALIAYRLTKLYQNKKTQIMVLCIATLVFVGLLFRELVIVQYSITSAICMAGAIFLYVTGKVKETTAATMKENIIPVILVILSFMIRTELCLMMMPFLLLAGLFRLILDPMGHNQKGIDIFRRNMFIVVLALTGMFAMLGLDSLAKHVSTVDQSWKRFERFFDARTKLYDFYNLPDYEENKEFYKEIGLSEESYTLLQNYNFSLDESIDEHLLEEIVTYSEKGAGKVNTLTSFWGLFYTRHTLSEGVWLYKQRFLTLSGGIRGFINACMYALFILMLLQEEPKKKFIQLIKVLLLFVLRSGLFMYLLMVDRALERVTTPLYLAEFVLLLGWQITLLQHRKQLPGKALFCTVLLMCGIVSICYNGNRTLTEYKNRERINPRWEAFMKYCDYFPEDYFVMDVFSSTSYDGIAYSEKIFKNVDNSIRNFDICGGWISKSPLYRTKIKQYGIVDLEKSLRQNEQATNQTYFVAAHNKDLAWLSAYYEHKGQKIQMEQVDTIWYQNEAIFDVFALKPAK